MKNALKLLCFKTRVCARADYNILRYIYPEQRITFQEADSGFWDFLHQATHEEFTAKIFCTNEGAIFWESYLVRGEFHPF